MRTFLRDDLEVHAGSPCSLLIDRAAGRSYRFAAPETVAIGVLARPGDHEAGEIGAAVRAAGFPVPDDAIARFVGELRALALLGRPSRARLHRLRRIRALFFKPPRALTQGQLREEPFEAGPPGPVEFLPGTALACRATGACCRRFLLGPLTPKDLERIARYRWPEGVGLPSGDEAVEEAAWGTGMGAGAGSGSGSGSGEGKIKMLRRKHGKCVFLGEDGLCEVHRRFGADAKPLVCRLFPFRPVRSGGTIRVSLSFECSAFEGGGKFPCEPAPGEAHAAAIVALAREAGRILAVPERPLVAGVEVERAELERRDRVAIAALLGEAPLAERLAAALDAYRGPAAPPHVRRALRHLLQDLRLAAREGVRAPGLLEGTRFAYRRLEAVLAPAAWRAPAALGPDAEEAAARSVAGAIFGKQHLRAPDALLGAAQLATFAALAARDAAARAAGAARPGGASPRAGRNDMLASLRDLAPAFESAGGLRGVLAIRFLESGFAAAAALPLLLLRAGAPGA